MALFSLIYWSNQAGGKQVENISPHVCVTMAVLTFNGSSTGLRTCIAKGQPGILQTFEAFQRKRYPMHVEIRKIVFFVFCILVHIHSVLSI